MADFPKSYKDPVYDAADSATEQRLGLPAGLLASIRLDGEKTNADRVSSAGAKTPYQFTPSTRDLILKKYGIDPYLNTDTASEAAGLLLKEALDRNNGDIESAVGEYHGGTNRENWGKVNQAYRGRVVDAYNQRKGSALSKDFAAWASENPQSGSLSSDFGEWLKRQGPEQTPQVPGLSAGDTAIETARSFLRGETLGTSDVLGAGVAAGAAALGGADFGEAYKDIKGSISQQRDQFRQENPVLAYGAELAGGVAPAIATGGAATLAPYASSTAVRAAMPIVAGAAQGAVYGASQAAPGQVLQDAGTGALIGGVIGGAIPTVAAGVKRLMRGAAPTTEELAQSAAQQVDNAPSQPVITPQAVAPDNVPQSVEPAIAQPSPIQPVAPVATVKPQGPTYQELVKQVKSGGAQSEQAMQQLAARAQIDNEAMAAAEQAGIDLPLDVYVDDQALRNAMGLGRSKITSPMRAEWDVKHSAAVAKADEALQELGANSSLSTVSENIKQSLSKTRAGIKAAEDDLYTGIRKSVPESSNVDMAATRQTAQEIIDSLGGEADASLVKLLESATSPKTTLAGLRQIKSKLGQQIETKGFKEPFGNTDTRMLRRLYKAVSEDELNNVEAIGGAEMRDNLAKAKALTAQRKALEKRITKAYGTDGEGSLATKLASAVKGGAKSGDVTQLNKLAMTLPDDMRAEAMLSSILHNARNAKNTGMNFEAYEKLYSGIMQHPEIAKVVFKGMSQPQRETLRGLYLVSKRVNSANTAIKHTGASLQKVTEELGLNNLLENMLQNNAASGVLKASAAKIPFADRILDAVVQSPEEKLQAFGAAITSPEFSDLARKTVQATASGSPVPQESVRKFATSLKFKALARQIGIPSSVTGREQFIIMALQPRAEQ